MTIHVLWVSAGLSCDGESVAITAATSPSLEDLRSGVIPGSPKIVLHLPDPTRGGASRPMPALHLRTAVAPLRKRNLMLKFERELAWRGPGAQLYGGDTKRGRG